MRQRRSGFSLVEILLTAALISFCLLVFLSVAATSLREATRSRDEILADEILLNTYDEILDSRFGDNQSWWGDGAPAGGDPRQAAHTDRVGIDVTLEGRPVQTAYLRRVEIASDHGGDGSFFGKQQRDYDVLKVSVFWTEATGNSARGLDKSKVSYLTVWRRPDGR